MYAKIYRGMWEGTLAGTGETWAVFVFLLAHCDVEGFVDVHPRVIASLTGFSEDRVREALVALESADPASRTPTEGGARIERVDAHRDWGWQVVNYQRYRSLKDSDSIRAQTRERVRKHREMKRSVTVGNAPKRHVEVDVEVQEPKAIAPGGAGKRAREIAYTPEFEAFWEAYRCVRRTGKPQAFREWTVAGGQRISEQVMGALTAYKATAQWREGFMPEPARWLKKRPWEDGPVPAEDQTW